MLHGRDAERALVAELLDATRRSQSRVLIVRGEPGVGKTALLEGARDGAGDLQVPPGRAVESSSDRPCAPLHQLLGPVPERLPEVPGPQARALGAALGLT